MNILVKYNKNMAQIVEAINEVYNVDKVNGYKVFLAGGITNCVGI